MRDEFTKGVKDVLAHRAGYRCSRPDCRASTAGPSWEGVDQKSNVGVAAHITAAAPGGPRYDASLSAEDRRSVANGIWLCQTHAKEVDDDADAFSPAKLRAWKEHAEEYARALVGRPIAGHYLEAAVEVSLQRGGHDSLLAVGTTNLPSGTKLWVELSRPAVPGPPIQSKTCVFERQFVAEDLRSNDGPLEQDWYMVTVLAYFNGPWRQPENVLEIVGKHGAHLAGPFAVPIDPDVEDSHTRLTATFECIAPPLRGAPALSSEQLGAALDMLKNTRVELKYGTATRTVGETVELFMSPATGLTPKDGWSVREALPGVVEASFSYTDSGQENRALWHVIPVSRSVRYRNRYGKYMSGTTTK